MEILFLTGMSGAGKSAAVRYLEDCGYFCMDNVPPYVLPDLVKSFYRGRSGEGFSTPKLAFVVDVRSQEYFDCSKFAEIFGGGGHVRASGFTVKDSDIYTVAEEVIEKVQNTL